MEPDHRLLYKLLKNQKFTAQDAVQAELAHCLSVGYRQPGEWINLQMRTYYLTSKESGVE